MSVGSSPDLYNILNTILSDTAPHSMSELYNISFTDGSSSVSSGTISLLSFQNKTINTGGSGGGSGVTYTYSSGFEWGYYNDNYHSGGYSGQQTWFYTRTPVYTHNTSGRSRVTDFTNISTASSGQTSVNGDETYSYLWTGYFKAPSTGTYYFNTRSDDNSHMWVGVNALNPRYDNETVDNGGLHGMQTVTSAGVNLTGGEYYDFRMTFGEEGGGDDLQAQWRLSTGSFTYDWSTVAFSNRQQTSSSGSSSGSSIVISTNVTSIYSSKITSFSSSSVTVSSVSGIAQGDWVMIHQTYYPTGNSNLSSVCPYEFKEISSISGSTLTFTTSITGVFIDGAQVIKAYRCNDFTLNSGISITTSAWNVNTYTGGIIPIYADGAVTINGTINMEGKGYQGREKTKSGSTFENGLNGRGIDNSDRGAGIGGLKGAGGSGNAGGGGGGGHENNGSIGNGSGSNSGNVSGGSAFGSTSGNYLTMGGSGGQGAPHDIAGAYQRGGHGGGAVFIQGTDITGSGTINVNGTSGYDNVNVRNWQGGAAGGAGGMVLFKTSSGTASFTNVTKNGGAGLSGTNGSSVAHSGYNGGNGSTGRFVNV
jgi:hypothetical protein